MDEAPDGEVVGDGPVAVESLLLHADVHARISAMPARDVHRVQWNEADGPLMAAANDAPRSE